MDSLPASVPLTASASPSSRNDGGTTALRVVAGFAAAAVCVWIGMAIYETYKQKAEVPAPSAPAPAADVRAAAAAAVARARAEAGAPRARAVTTAGAGSPAALHSASASAGEQDAVFPDAVRDGVLASSPNGLVNALDDGSALTLLDEGDANASTVARMREGVLGGLRKAFVNASSASIKEDNVRLPTEAGARWAQQNERLLAIRDGGLSKKRAAVLGMYTDLRPMPARPARGVNELLAFGIPEALADHDGNIDPVDIAGRFQ